MKTFQQFLNEKNMSIEDLNSLGSQIREQIVKKLQVSSILVQNNIVYMDQPFPHLHCKTVELSSGLPEQDKFLADEICKTFAEICKENNLQTVLVKKGDPHGQPGDVLAILK